MRAFPIAVAALGLVAAAPAPPLRIAATGPATAACAAVGDGAPAGEKAYYDHLSKRLQREVLKCPFASRAEAATALAAGKVDMAWLDPATFAPVQAQTRAILTVRATNTSNRIPVYVAVRSADPARDLAALKGRLIAFGGASPAGHATPRAILAERGLGAGAYREKVEVDGDAALAELRKGAVDAVAVHAAAWQRVCRMVSPKDPEPCRDLRVLAKARPEAAEAIVIRRDMPDELRFRLIGIHMPLHLEAPAAFAYAAASPGAAEFQPAEALALTLANLK